MTLGGLVLLSQAPQESRLARSIGAIEGVDLSLAEDASRVSEGSLLSEGKSLHHVFDVHHPLRWGVAYIVEFVLVLELSEVGKVKHVSESGVLGNELVGGAGAEGALPAEHHIQKHKEEAQEEVRVKAVQILWARYWVRGSDDQVVLEDLAELDAVDHSQVEGKTDESDGELERKEPPEDEVVEQTQTVDNDELRKVAQEVVEQVLEPEGADLIEVGLLQFLELER